MYVVLESDLQDMQTFDKVLKINDQYILALSPFPWVTLGWAK